MDETVVLVWQFSPADAFEEPTSLVAAGQTINIADGKAEARIAATAYNSSASLRQQLHAALNARLNAIEILSHRECNLEKSVMTRVDAAGRKHYFLEAEPATYRLTGSPVDFVVTDAQGNTVNDTKRARVLEKQLFGEQIEGRLSDPVVASIVQSYHRAVRHPDDELVYLYEISDTLSEHFGGKHAARSALGLSGNAWSRFKRLCNIEPLNQGRHRGRSFGTLRDATAEELAEARQFARTMIRTYLNRP
jgi:hypothetical protein